MFLLKVIVESIRQAMQQLFGSKLRSFLSLLGITIGIFCIIGVQSAVDSLEDNVRGSFEKLGDDVIYVNRFSWAGGPNDWWKYLKRPTPNYTDYEAVKAKSTNAALVAYDTEVGSRTVKYGSNSVSQVDLKIVSMEYAAIVNLSLSKGRFFSSTEYHYGANKIVLGANVATELFGGIEPVGKKIKVRGRSMEVIGVIEKEGDSLVGVNQLDDAMLISYELGKSLVNLKSKYNWSTTVSVKSKPNVSVDDLRDELTGILRAHRRLKPKEADNFSLNELTMLSTILDSFFNVLNVAGLFIGLFAILVGMFSVANIMFVSVKERTNIIGIKKALGAKRYIILLEFLIESIILCTLGGLMGLGLVRLITSILSSVLGFDMHLSWNNIIFGVSLSVIVGIVSGIIPAWQAARMDPVEAIRK